MHCNRLRLDVAGRLFLGLFLLSVSVQAQDSSSPLTNLKRLLEGNERFVTGKLKPRDYLAERVQLAEAQHPYAIIVTCADSRLSPEILFDESLGKLFVVRTAGHVVDPVVLGSIEYAAEHLHVNLVFFLGHENCGAVKAAIAGGEFSPNISALTTRIRPAVDKALNRVSGDKELLNAAIAENVQYQMSLALFQSDPLKHLVGEQKVVIAGGVYQLRSGRVQMIEPSNSHSTSEGNESAASENLSKKQLADSKETEAKVAGTRARKSEQAKISFAEEVRHAFEEKLNLELQKPMLMRNNDDRCFFDDCRSIPAGEKVKVVSPQILKIMGRHQLRVSYKGQRIYVLADPEAFRMGS